jgi:hypothetical protein
MVLPGPQAPSQSPALPAIMMIPAMIKKNPRYVLTCFILPSFFLVYVYIIAPFKPKVNQKISQ